MLDHFPRGLLAAFKLRLQSDDPGPARLPALGCGGDFSLLLGDLSLCRISILRRFGRCLGGGLNAVQDARFSVKISRPRRASLSCTTACWRSARSFPAALAPRPAQHLLPDRTQTFSGGRYCERQLVAELQRVDQAAQSVDASMSAARSFSTGSMSVCAVSIALCG